MLLDMSSYEDRQELDRDDDDEEYDEWDDHGFRNAEDYYGQFLQVI